MRGFIIGLLLAGVVVVGQEKAIDKTASERLHASGPGTVVGISTPVRAPISLPAAEAAELKDAYTNAVLADAQWKNRVLQAKVDHGVPPDYGYNLQFGRFDPPAPKQTTAESPKP